MVSNLGGKICTIKNNKIFIPETNNIYSKLSKIEFLNEGIFLSNENFGFLLCKEQNNVLEGKKIEIIIFEESKLLKIKNVPAKEIQESFRWLRKLKSYTDQKKDILFFGDFKGIKQLKNDTTLIDAYTNIIQKDTIHFVKETIMVLFG